MNNLVANFETPEQLSRWYDAYMPLVFNLGYGLFILIIGWAVAKRINRVILTGLRGAKIDEALCRFLSSMAQYCVLAAVVIAALNRLGFQTTSLVALLASAGLAISLALQGSLSSFAAGVMILFFRPFTLGDYVQLSGHHGLIDDIGLFQTTLACFEGETVIIPNSAIMTAPIINYSTRGVRRATITVGVAYGVDVPTTIEKLKAAANSVETGLQDPPLFLQFFELGASSLDFRVGLWCHAQDFGATITALRTAIYNELNNAGIEIPFQQIVVHQAEAAA